MGKPTPTETRPPADPVDIPEVLLDRTREFVEGALTVARAARTLTWRFRDFEATQSILRNGLDRDDESYDQVSDALGIRFVYELMIWVQWLLAETTGVNPPEADMSAALDVFERDAEMRGWIPQRLTVASPRHERPAAVKVPQLGERRPPREADLSAENVARLVADLPDHFKAKAAALLLQSRMAASVMRQVVLEWRRLTGAVEAMVDDGYDDGGDLTNLVNAAIGLDDVFKVLMCLGGLITDRTGCMPSSGDAALLDTMLRTLRDEVGGGVVVGVEAF